MNKNKRIETAHRSALTELVADIVNLPMFDTHTKRVIAFACLYTRIFKGEDNITYITALSTGGLNKPPTDHAIYKLATKLNAALHIIKDDDGDLVFNQANGTLSEKWQADMVNIAHAMEAITPPAFLPSQEAINLTYPTHGCGTPLINTTKKFGNQSINDMPLVYKALNVLQAQEFKLNRDMIDLHNLPVGIEHGKNYSARHIMLTNTEAFKNTFHFRYTMDYRGRVYCRALFANTQGDSFAKAFIEFAETKPLGQHGYSALKIHFANCSGHDKLSFDDRLAWANETGLLKAFRMAKCEGDWKLIEPLIEDNKHAYEEYAAACEYLRAFKHIREGNDVRKFLSRLITHQDATNSGFQFGAALTGDRETAEDVNITATQTRSTAPADLYKKMAYNLQRLLQGSGLLKKLPTIDRSFCKTPIMVTGYGAGIKAVMRDVDTYLKKKGIVIDEAILDELSPYMKDALKQTASAMVDTTQVMHNHAKTICESGAETIEWSAPDGFKIIQQKRDNSGRKIELGNKQVTFLKFKVGEKDPIDEAGMTKALPPNFIHSMDAQMLRTAALGCDNADIAFAPIHDSFGTHAGSFFELNTILKLAFVQTMDYNWYSEFCEANNLPIDNIRSGDYNHRECLQSVYMFS